MATDGTIPGGLVQRPRLVACLVVDPAPVTLLSAPAGSGKTTLLASLVEAADGDLAAPAAHDDDGSVVAIPTAWVALGEQHDAPEALWSAVLDALRRLPVSATGDPIHDLRVPLGVVDGGFLDGVVGAIERIGQPVRIVVDDVHHLRDEVTIASLDRLLLRPPDNLLIVLSGRHDPPLSLGRLRLAGRLRELRAADLAFDQGELADLLTRAGHRLEDADRELLLARTEGWAAALRIAVLALRDTSDPHGLLASFDGGDRGVADGLVTEVLDNQPPALIEVLIRTSICDPIPVDLAVELSGHADAGDLLERSTHLQAFVRRVGRGRDVYRLHPLLRAYASAELRRRSPHEERVLHRAAAAWCAAQGDWEAAVAHLGRADQPQGVDALLRGNTIAVLLDGDGARVGRVLASLPPSMPASDVVDLLAYAATLLVDGPLAADRHLDAERLVRLARSPDRWVATLAAAVQVNRETFDGPPGPALATLSALLEQPAGDPRLDLFARNLRAYGTLIAGDRGAGVAQLRDVVSRARSGGYDAIVVSGLSHLALVALMAGQLRDTTRDGEAALELAGRRGWARSPLAMPAHLVLSWAAYQQVQREVAAHHVAIASTALDATSDPRLVRSMRTCEVLLRIDVGEDLRLALRDHLRDQLRADAPVMTPVFHAHVGPDLVRAALRAGAPGLAHELERVHGDADHAPAELALMRAMRAASAGDDGAARQLLAPVVDGTLTAVSRSTDVTALLASAVIDDRRGSGARANEQLTAALERAEPTELLRPFVAMVPEAQALLAAAADRSGRLAAFAHRALRLLADLDGGERMILLTPAEAAVLRELPSLLSVREIAEARQVSVNTVKTHLRSIYLKLDVGGRREAVAAARGRGLL